ncbi:uncharacterized protein FMAN_14328 [Fusarium mangiferae]|uniref:Uncharacterized protein n=1 Tax=Fusarium mangiferae TaxID=192010 RepID=A0A1L7U9I7_FUSMA|nr:uncharacterized protein FMAN_14328 [Fusarium mangiferae]CVL07384.1 uncharacterized protein FMAN_14328 [Fusarium mangiferae]
MTQFVLFRWAHLQIELLIALQSPEAVEARLGKLPHGLAEAYDELYERTESYDRIYLQRAVKWVLYAFDPLSTEQLLSAVQLRLVDGHDDPVLDTRNRRLSVEALENICRHLIVRGDRDEWAFSHTSVQEYFREKKHHRKWTNEDAQIEVAMLSLLALIDTVQYLIASVSLRSIVSLWHPDSEKTFEDYVAQYWVSHIKSLQYLPYEIRKPISKVLRKFMISSTDPGDSAVEYRTWLKYVRKRQLLILGKGDSRVWVDDLMPTKNPAFGIVSLGLDLDEEKWAKDSLQLHLGDFNYLGLDTLSLAAKYGSVGFRHQLMDLGIRLNTVSPIGSSALNEAIKSRNLNCVAEFLERNADPNLDTNSCPLCQAARQKCPELVRLLLKYGALPDALYRDCLF